MIITKTDEEHPLYFRWMPSLLCTTPCGLTLPPTGTLLLGVSMSSTSCCAPLRPARECGLRLVTGGSASRSASRRQPRSGWVNPSQRQPRARNFSHSSRATGEAKCCRLVRERASLLRGAASKRYEDDTSACLTPYKVLIIGGTGAVGSAAAFHLLQSSPVPLEVVLAGRSSSRGNDRLHQVMSEMGGEGSLSKLGHTLGFQTLDWRDGESLRSALDGATAVLHTAGPYAGQQPDILSACIQRGVPCYVDLSDPLEYIDAALGLSGRAAASGTMALLASGAFPGFSNLIAVECASRLDHPVSDLSFRYFTAGLGGSGPLNLLITNQGFGEPVPRVEGGVPAPALVSGLEAERVKFFIDESDMSASRVGERTVWSWPFPEVSTVARALDISNNSSVKMGTSPDLWNVIMGWLVKIVPRTWWKNLAFSQFMADFSEPMVRLTDRFVGETHCMRVDVTDTSGSTCTAVQGHDSFRRVVGQSCAEFALNLLERHLSATDKPSAWRPGVYLPEQLMSEEYSNERRELLERLAVLPGTFTYRFSLRR